MEEEFAFALKKLYTRNYEKKKKKQEKVLRVFVSGKVVVQ